MKAGDVVLAPLPQADGANQEPPGRRAFADAAIR